MTRIKHKFIDHQIDPNTETLIIGTFNPEIEGNKAEFFYGRSKNYLWTLVPIALGDDDLKGKTKPEKIAFIKKHKIDFIDLIFEIKVQCPLPLSRNRKKVEIFKLGLILCRA